MGKKASGKAQSKPTQEEASPQETEGLTLSGVFATDFPLLCEQRGLPALGVKTLHQREVDCTEEEAAAPPPRFSVLVEYRDPEDVASLHCLFVRGWLLSEGVLAALSEALASSHQLTTINVWNVGLNEQTLAQLTALAVELKLKQLILDGNSVSVGPIVELIKATSSLEVLSLKCCGLADPFLAQISSSLADNKTLTHLNLSCNHIANEGASSLATSLRLNRTLLSLALANNSIGDEGAAALAEVLSRFALNHQEIVMRRILLSKVEEGMSQLEIDRTKDYSPRRSPSVSSVDKGGSRGRQQDKATAKGGKKAEPKKDDKSKKDGGKKGGDAKKGKGGREVKGGKKGGPEQVSEEPPKAEPAAEAVNPLLYSQVEKDMDRIYLPGNTSLVYLSLAYNGIGEDGVRALLQSVKVQQGYSHLGPGLLRLTLHHNPVPGVLPELGELGELLASRDPLIRETEGSTTTEHSS